MIYICTYNNCHFSFERIDEPDCCPNCGKEAIRLATKVEQQEFEDYKKMHEGKNKE